MNKRKVVFITGSTKGIGRAISDRFDLEKYLVVRNGRETCFETCAERGCLFDCHYVAGDVGTIEGRKRISNYIKGDVDILINNAGYTEFVEHGEDLEEELIDRIYEVNFKAPLLLSQMLRPKEHIINIASVAGVNAKGSNVAYCAMKAALINLTQSLARALGPVRVNSVSPGLVPTGFVTFPGDYINETISQTPIGRAGGPHDIADVVVSLVEDMKHITGQNIIVDGGRFLN